MKIKERDVTDIFGTYPCCWVSGKDACPQNIHEWLFKHYQGYKLAIILDCTKDAFEDIKETPVYFIDDILKEIIDYIGIKEVEKRVESIKQSRENNNINQLREKLEEIY